MLKLLLCSALVMPCVILPFTAQGNSPVAVDTVGFVEVYVSPEMAKIESCETAELDVYFHDSYITMHSAEYIEEAIKLTEHCDGASFSITPVLNQSSTDKSRALMHIRTTELSATLAAYDVNAEIGDTVIKSEYDSLLANGRSAILKISLKSNKSS